MPLAAAGIAAGGSILGGIAGGKGASKAAKAQAQAQEQALQLQQQEFGTISGDAQPNINAGNSAVQQMLRLLGLGDSNTGQSVNGVTNTAAQQQQGAWDALQQSPEYTSEFNSGLQGVDQSLAASGGLRGGNGVLAQSDFGSGLLNSLFQQQLGNLGTVAGIGQNALGTLSSAGSNMVDQSSKTISNIGLANSGAAVAPYNAFQQILSGLGTSGLFSSSGSSSTVGSGYMPAAAALPNVSVMSGYTPPIW